MARLPLGLNDHIYFYGLIETRTHTNTTHKHNISFNSLFNIALLSFEAAVRVIGYMFIFHYPQLKH